MNLQAAIADKKNALQQQASSAQEQRAAQLNAAIERLKPMFSLLQDGLKGTHLTVVLHTNPSHYPCPAIHIRGMHPFTPAYDRLTEIFMLSNDADARWKSGSCNMHHYSHKDDAALTDFVATWVAYDLEQRKPR